MKNSYLEKAKLKEKIEEVDLNIKLLSSKFIEKHGSMRYVKNVKDSLLTFRSGYERKDFSAKELKEKHPDIYNKFEKRSMVKGSPMLKKLRNNI